MSKYAVPIDTLRELALSHSIVITKPNSSKKPKSRPTLVEEILAAEYPDEEDDEEAPPPASAEAAAVDEDDGEGPWQVVGPKGKVLEAPVDDEDDKYKYKTMAPAGTLTADERTAKEEEMLKESIKEYDDKFNKEIDEFNDLNEEYYKRGKTLLPNKDEEEYNKKAEVLFKKLKQTMMIFLTKKGQGARLGFYDDTKTNVPNQLSTQIFDPKYSKIASDYYVEEMADIQKMINESKAISAKAKTGKGKPLANYLSNPKQQYNRMGRPISNDDKINNEMIKMGKKFQNNNPIHETPVGSLYPFYEKTDDAKYDFPTKLRYERNIRQPPKNALGADYSLLQGEIGGPTVNKEVKRSYKPSERQVVTPAQALQNVLSGAGKKSGALKKLVFDDEANDMYGSGEGYGNRGFIPEDKEDHFKLPDLKKKKEKEMAAKLSGRRK